MDIYKSSVLLVQNTMRPMMPHQLQQSLEVIEVHLYKPIQCIHGNVIIGAVWGLALGL